MLRRIARSLVLALAIAAMGALTAMAQLQVPLPLLEDATVAPVAPPDPNRLETDRPRGISGPCTVLAQSLLKFDASVLSSDITTATLSLQYTEYTGPASGVIVGIWPVSDDWDELTVTWETRPVSSGAPVSTRSSPMPPLHEPLVFPSTPALVAFINNQRPAHGGDGRISFATGLVDCPPLSTGQWRNPSKENPLNLPAVLDVGFGPPTSVTLVAFEGAPSGQPPGPQLAPWAILIVATVLARLLILGRARR